MATSFAHFGDLHTAPGPRNEARYRAFDQAIDGALQLPRLGAFLVPGDLSHQRQAIDDENALIARLRRMSAAAPVVIVYGNHDLEGDLDKFRSVANGHPIYVVDRPTVLRIKLATGEYASIACLPYPHKAGLVMAGCANPDIVDEAAHHLDAIFMRFAAELEDARQAGDLTLFIGHANVGGAIASNGQPNIGKEIELSPRHLDRLGPIYKGLNHIHKAQDIHGAFYPGSICRLDWGEIEEKRWLEVGISADASWGGFGGDGPWSGDAAIGVYDVWAHALDVAPMYYVDANLDRDGFSWACTAGPGGELQDTPKVECQECLGRGAVMESLDEGGQGPAQCGPCDGSGRVVSWKGCEVRVRVRYKASEFPVLDKTKLLAEFAEASLVQFDPIPEKDHALRAPEVAAAKTLAGKFAAMLAINGTVASDGVLFKLGKLETCDPVVVIENARDFAADIAAGHEDEKATVAA
jgi:hypothetical protein